MVLVQLFSEKKDNLVKSSKFFCFPFMFSFLFSFLNYNLCHFLYRTLTPGHDPVQKVTLIPRGQARGLTWFLPGEDSSLVSKQQIFARIVGGLGGRAAEEVIFGEPEITTGAAGDLQQITQIARQVIIIYICLF